MIKISKSNSPPNILARNKNNWTDELLVEINNYGSFTNLPDNIKRLVKDRYSNIEIKSALIPTDDTKCSFCETIPNESGYIEIEHFLPKSIYPDNTYSWKNLLPSCKRCNLKKLDFDTGIYPIVKPDEDDPAEYFEYNNIKIITKNNSVDKVKAERTIKKLDLNQYRLIKPRSELLVSLVNYENDLDKTLSELSTAKNTNKITRLLNNIYESLDKIDELTKSKAKFAGFCRYYIFNSKAINEAREKIKNI